MTCSAVYLYDVVNTRESCVNVDVAKWGTNSWEIEETTSHKAGSSAVFNITFEREGKKRSYYNTGYLYLVTHPGTIVAE